MGLERPDIVVGKVIGSTPIFSTTAYIVTDLIISGDSPQVHWHIEKDT